MTLTNLLGNGPRAGEALPGQPDMVAERDLRTNELVAGEAMGRGVAVREALSVVQEAGMNLGVDLDMIQPVDVDPAVTEATVAQAEAYANRNQNARADDARLQVERARAKGDENFLDKSLAYAADDGTPAHVEEPEATTAAPVIDPRMSVADQVFLMDHNIAPPAIAETEQAQATQVAAAPDMWREAREAGEADPYVPTSVQIADEIKAEDAAAVAAEQKRLADLEVLRARIKQLHEEGILKDDVELAA